MSITPSTPLPPNNSASAQPAETALPVIPQPDAMAHIGKEYGTGKENLPPAKLVGIVLGVLVVLLAIFAFVFRAKSPAVGSIDDIEVADVAGQNAVMLAVNVSFRNDGEKEYKMQSINAELETATGTHEDHPASAVDFDRYLDAFPNLKTNSIPRLELQTVEPNGRRSGRVVVSFPVTADEFAKRKALRVKVYAYGESVPLVMTK